jgi:hypothetical protein
VSPELDGWTLVFGNIAQTAHLQAGAAQMDAWMAVIFAACRGYEPPFRRSALVAPWQRAHLA